MSAKAPAKYSKAWYRQQLAQHCDFYGVDLQILEILAIRFFAERLEHKPRIWLDERITLELTDPETKPVNIQDADWWKEGGGDPFLEGPRRN